MSEALDGVNRVEADGALDELRQEHEFAQRLLEELLEMGQNITAGELVPPQRAQIGVALLDAYLHRVHASQEDRVLRPEVESVAMSTCFAHLDAMGRFHQEMRDRTQRVLAHIRQWASGEEGVTLLLGRELAEIGSKDYEALQYEETYPLSCLQAGLPPDADRQLYALFSRHAGTRRALEARIGRFLNGTYRT